MMRPARTLILTLVLLVNLSSVCASSPDNGLQPISVDALLGMTFIKENRPLAITADGRLVAFTVEDRRMQRPVQGNATQCDGCRIVLVDTSSGRLTDISPSGVNAWMPTWSSDGSRLAFFADEGNGAHLWVWSSGSPARRVTHSPFGITAWAEIRWVMQGSAVAITISAPPASGPRQSATDLRRDGSPDQPTVEVRTSPRSAVANSPLATAGQVEQRLVKIDIQTGDMTEISVGSSGVAAVSPDGSRLVYARYRADIQRRDGAQYQSYFDLWLGSVNSDQPVRLAEAVPLAFPMSARVSWSPDGQYVAYQTLGLASERKIVIMRVVLRPNEEAVVTNRCAVRNTAHEAPLWNDDNSAVIFSDGDSIRECGAAAGREQTLATIRDARLDYILRRAQDRLWSPSNRKAVWVLGRSIAGGPDAIYEVNSATGKATIILAQQRAIGGNSRVVPQVSASEDGKFVVFSSESANEPADLWGIRRGQDPKRLTTLNRALSSIEMGKSELVEWTSSTGEKARALTLLPAGYKPGRKYPTIVWVYAEATPYYANTFGLSGSQFYNLQMFATRGYAVVYPDITWKPGSLMRDVAEQVLPAADYLIKQGISDPERIGVIGHSSGGYDVLSLLVRTDRFRAAVVSNGVGIYDLASTFAGDMDYGRTSEWVVKQMKVGVAPWEAPQAYVDNSPAYHLDRITTPLLMLEGLGDNGWNNVAQSEYLFSALKWLGKTVEYRRYPGEQHAPDWWSPANKRDAEVRMLNWFSEYLGGAGAGN